MYDGAEQKVDGRDGNIKTLKQRQGHERLTAHGVFTLENVAYSSLWPEVCLKTSGRWGVGGVWVSFRVRWWRGVFAEINCANVGATATTLQNSQSNHVSCFTEQTKCGEPLVNMLRGP